MASQAGQQRPPSRRCQWSRGYSSPPHTTHRPTGGRHWTSRRGMEINGYKEDHPLKKIVRSRRKSLTRDADSDKLTSAVDEQSYAGVAQLVEQLICNQQVGGSSPSTSSKTSYGGVPEWPKGADCKSVAFRFGGSNPPSSTSSSQAVYRLRRTFFIASAAARGASVSSRRQAFHCLCQRKGHSICGSFRLLLSHKTKKWDLPPTAMDTGKKL